MTYEALLDKWIRKLGRPCTAGEIVHDLRQMEQPVRCKDCKWHEEIHGWYRCLWWHNVTEPGVFCSMGERREEG